MGVHHGTDKRGAGLGHGGCPLNDFLGRQVQHFRDADQFLQLRPGNFQINEIPAAQAVKMLLPAVGGEQGQEFLFAEILREQGNMDQVGIDTDIEIRLPNGTDMQGGKVAAGKHRAVAFQFRECIMQNLEKRIVCDFAEKGAGVLIKGREIPLNGLADEGLTDQVADVRRVVSVRVAVFLRVIPDSPAAAEGVRLMVDGEVKAEHGLRGHRIQKAFRRIITERKERILLEDRDQLMAEIHQAVVADDILEQTVGIGRMLEDGKQRFILFIQTEEMLAVSGEHVGGFNALKEIRKNAFEEQNRLIVLFCE